MKQKQIEMIKARELRQQGWSITGIAKELNVTKSSVSVWCRDIALSQEQIDRLVANSRANACHLTAAEDNRNARIVRQLKRQADGIKDVGQISDRELFLIGSALYLGEGGKTKALSFSNSDPEIVRLFVKWLTHCLKVPLEKIRLQLHIHQDLSEQEEKRFWQQELEIPEEQFYKTQIKKNPLTGHRKKKEYHGTMGMYVQDINLFYYIEGLMRAIKNNSMRP